MIDTYGLLSSAHLHLSLLLITKLTHLLFHGIFFFFFFFFQVLITLYWLGRKAQSNPYYNGPYLNLKAFENLLGQALTKVRKLYLYETLTLTNSSYLPLPLLFSCALSLLLLFLQNMVALIGMPREDCYLPADFISHHQGVSISDRFSGYIGIGIYSLILGNQ